MIEFPVENEIARTAAQVFAYVTDSNKLAIWQTNTGLRGRGGRRAARPGDARGASRPRRQAARVARQVSEYEPDRTFALHVIEGALPIDAGLTFEPAERGTVVRFAAHGQLTGAMRLAQPLLRRTLKRQFTGHCATIKRVLENDRPHCHRPISGPDAAMGTPWDALTYDQSSEPQQAWASEVLARLEGVAQDATAMDVGCGTGRVTEALLALVPRGRVLAVDASADMVALAREWLGDRAEVWCQDVLDLDLDEPVDAIVSTATLHWVADHDRLWARLARALRPGGVLEAQCGGEGNIARVREVIEAVARDAAPELVGWSPWVFAGPQETERRLREAGFTATRCWLEERPTHPQDVDAFVRTSILPAHLARLPEEQRERFAAAVVAGVRLPLDFVRLNVSAVREPA